MRRSPLAWCLAIAIGTIVAVASCGCRGQYENENGPRGPERVSWGPGWPEANPCDKDCAPR